MKQHYYDWTGRDFFSVCNCILEKRAKAERKRRVRKVRVWLLRRAWREVRGGRICFIAVSVWVLVAAQWIWMKVVAA